MGSHDKLPQPAPAESGAWLRFGDHDVEIPEGETIVGRGQQCGVILDDPLVSRSHARIVSNRGVITIEDLESANGTLVNEEPVLRARILQAGDRVIIGQQAFVVFVVARTEPPPPSQERRTATPRSERRALSAIEAERSEATRKGDALDLLGSVAEKVLALGRGEEAERIMSSYLANLLSTARTNGEVDAIVAEKAVMYAVRMAEATGKGTWVDYVFDLYAVVGRPLPATIVEHLYASLRNISEPSINVFREYISVLRTVEPKLGPSERFLMRRIEGLEAFSVFR